MLKNNVENATGNILVMISLNDNVMYDLVNTWVGVSIAIVDGEMDKDKVKISSGEDYDSVLHNLGT